MQCLWAASNVTWIAWGLLLGCFACKRNVMAWSHSWKNSSAVWNSAGGLVLKHPQLFRNTRRAMGVEHSQSLWLLGLRTTMFERSWKHPDSTLLQKTSANFLPKKNTVWICKNWMHLGTSFFWKSYALDSTDRCIFNLNNEYKGKRFGVWVSSRSLYSFCLKCIFHAWCFPSSSSKNWKLGQRFPHKARPSVVYIAPAPMLHTEVRKTSFSRAYCTVRTQSFQNVNSEYWKPVARLFSRFWRLRNHKTQEARWTTDKIKFEKFDKWEKMS